jgi:predicted MPP superfamily phosphohydrolase
VTLAELPDRHDGLVLVQLSDLHLGSLLGADWMAAVVERVQALEPDLVVLTGDILEGDSGEERQLLTVLRRLSAPLGVWAVTGNHEYYAGLERSIGVLESAGYTVLRDRSEQVAPGLVLAGVDDLTARRQFKLEDDPMAKALGSRPAGAVVLLCHSPLEVERAAELGADLMLSGHTHGGQIWPFVYMVGRAYPRVQGRYRVDGMTLLVSRGTGTWGPRMRLFHRAEIVKITLRSASKGGQERRRNGLGPV